MMEAFFNNVSTTFRSSIMKQRDLYVVVNHPPPKKMKNKIKKKKKRNIKLKSKTFNYKLKNS